MALKGASLKDIAHLRKAEVKRRQTEKPAVLEHTDQEPSPLQEELKEEAHEPLPSEKELRNMMKKQFPFEANENQFELGEMIVFPMSVDEYYETFLKHQAPFNYTVYYTDE